MYDQFTNTHQHDSQKKTQPKLKYWQLPELSVRWPQEVRTFLQHMIYLQIIDHSIGNFMKRTNQKIVKLQLVYWPSMNNKTMFLTLFPGFPNVTCTIHMQYEPNTHLWVVHNKWYMMICFASLYHINSQKSTCLCFCWEGDTKRFRFRGVFGFQVASHFAGV